jgi:heat shock protein HslJ
VTIELLDEQEAVPDQPLVGTTWTLDTIIDGETASSVPAGIEAPTLEIADDGTVAVFTGCNRGNGTAEVADDGATITFGPLAITKMLCPDGGSEVEAQVLTVLDGEVQVELDGDQLTLTKGDQALGFRAG